MFKGKINQGKTPREQNPLEKDRHHVQLKQSCAPFVRRLSLERSQLWGESGVSAFPLHSQPPVREAHLTLESPTQGEFFQSSVRFQSPLISRNLPGEKS